MNQYKILAPIGTHIVPKEVMTEEELRDHAVQIAEGVAEREIWKEKAEKDSIEEVISWLGQLGYRVTKV